MTYYDRSSATHLDGSLIFKTGEDEAAEARVATMIKAAWSCELQSLGKLAAVDWVAIRFGRPVGVLELKARKHDTQKYPTVFLNLRKWLALALSQIALNVPAIFVVEFSNSTKWIPLSDIDATKIRIGGCREYVKSTNDIEPVIEVPVVDMRLLTSSDSVVGSDREEVV